MSMILAILTGSPAYRDEDKADGRRHDADDEEGRHCARVPDSSERPSIFPTKRLFAVNDSAGVVVLTAESKQED